jgi:nucleoside-diphosphate-sugar epimerase
MTAKPILVTGATGCLGAQLTRRLVADGHDVVLLKRHGDQLGMLGSLRRGVEIRFGDVTDPASVHRAMRGIGSVYHLAGVAAPLNRLARVMWEVNVAGAYNVARAALEAKVDRMVHTSSVAAIGYPPDSVTANESFAAEESVGETAYSITKRHGEAIVRGLFTLGLDVVVVNPSAVLAPGGDARFSWSGLVAAALRGQLRAMPRGGTAVCTADDLVDGQLKAMSHGQAGERYILSSANVSYRELGRLIADTVGVTPPFAEAPDWALGAIGRVNQAIAGLRRDPYRSSVLVPENVALMTRALYYDQSRAVRELGITQSPLEPAIQEMAMWCRQSALGGAARGRRSS